MLVALVKNETRIYRNMNNTFEIFQIIQPYYSISLSDKSRAISDDHQWILLSTYSTIYKSSYI